MNKYLCTRIQRINTRNREHRRKVAVPNTKVVKRVLELFVKRGLIESYAVSSTSGVERLYVYMKKPMQQQRLVRAYVVGGDVRYQRQSFIKKPFRSMTMVSTPGRHVYASRHEVRTHYTQGHTLYLLATSRGGYCFADKAVWRNIGGMVCVKIVL